MTGSGIGPELGGWQAEGETKTQGHFFYAVDPGSFIDFNQFVNHAERYIRQIKNSRKAENVTEIRMPGERAAGIRRRQKETGVELLEVTWQSIAKLAAELGVNLPPVQPA
ncbi:MAG: Ldh family oxidoreductase [Desulfobacterales bacterium]|nr:MAG: Ldh family oxidoreductase [Desulfobacterales bacterium]